MPRATRPTDLWSLSLQSGLMLAEAQAVIAMRVMGMFGFWHVAPQENTRMVTEKLAALRDGHAAAVRSAVRGEGVAAVAEAAMKPMRRRTRANAARLAAKGPRLPG